MDGHGYFPSECAPEIEIALVCGLWHEPDRLAEVMRWLVPAVHLRQPYLRLVIEALLLCYNELGACDWASVLACLTELGYLGECGGREGLDNLYSARWYQPLFPFYCEEIRKAGRERLGRPVLPKFTGGTGSIVYDSTNKRFNGSARIAGKLYRISGKPADQDGINLNFYPQ
jgi:hypothetical protein